jgi:quercetin dioxygenase-like cupin family protein
MKTLYSTVAIFAVCLLVPAAAAFEPIISLPGEHRTIHPDGASNEVLATHAQTGGQLGIMTLSGAPGPGSAIVHTKEAEIWYVLEGEYEFYVGDKTFQGGPGTFVAVDAGQPHGFTNKNNGKLLVIFTPGGYEEFFVDWEEQGLARGPALGELERSYGVTRPAALMSPKPQL